MTLQTGIPTVDCDTVTYRSVPMAWLAFNHSYARYVAIPYKLAFRLARRQCWRNGWVLEPESVRPWAHWPDRWISFFAYQGVSDPKHREILAGYKPNGHRITVAVLNPLSVWRTA